MKTFLGLEIETTRDTFIPRPETELLVKTCLGLLDRERPSSILDIGTGSGNIPVSLAYHMCKRGHPERSEGLTKMSKTCTIIALDRSFEALEVAVRNAERHGVRDRVTFIQSDLFSGLADPYNNFFDMIVSNPPYVAAWEIATLAFDVRNEPLMALDGGDDGLEAIRKIIQGAPRFLKNGASLVMEIGYDQAYRVKKAFEACGGYKDIGIIRDLSNIERIVKARWTR